MGKKEDLPVKPVAKLVKATKCSLLKGKDGKYQKKGMIETHPETLVPVELVDKINSSYETSGKWYEVTNNKN